MPRVMCSLAINGRMAMRGSCTRLILRLPSRHIAGRNTAASAKYPSASAPCHCSLDQRPAALRLASDIALVSSAATKGIAGKTCLAP
ncbi:MAG: hypothetical protein IPF99_06290 [Deltaproteobacteria bacterium]|nr:hypothetical protein [Deltaproteobacteria bacterium]